MTHHLTSSLQLDPRTGLSLVELAKIVKPEWLREVLRLGQMVRTEGGLSAASEDTFVLPSEVNYEPAWSATIPSFAKARKYWIADEGRQTLFTSFHFLFIGEAGRETFGDMKTLVKEAAGNYATFSVAQGQSKFGALLSKSKSKGKIILVANESDMVAAIGPSMWKEMIDIASE